MIKLQNDLIESKEQQTQLVQNTVKSSVAETVKAEFVSFSDSVKKTQSKGPTIAPAALKSVVKKVAEEEDRSRTLMVFGLEEEEGEPLQEKIGDLFLELGERPMTEASRIGATKGKAARPVKVSFRSSVAAGAILAKSKS